ncbi:hypothetical protein BKA70DRAFT_1420509 [Coprinopsis sp. MPI-PUGE-AT-0042]|nr:hypothetical protein BKA70DRAFT_1420509 [Coprinopsis sp. MPI-PUGE-AT-0042]
MPNSIHFQLNTDDETKGDRRIPRNVANPHKGLETFHGVDEWSSLELTSLPFRRERKISKTTYATLQRLFELVVGALETLQGKLVVEPVVDNLITGLFRLFPSREQSSYPTKFSRMWLSKVTDYNGGALNNAEFLMPYLIHSPASIII